MTRDLSGGTRQKLNLALALLADPTVLLLDEPYQGFDRGTYVNFWDHCETWRRAEQGGGRGHPHAGRAVAGRPRRRAGGAPVAGEPEPVPVRSLRRILIMAEMHGRDLTRRHVALGLLVALPLSFYLASRATGERAVVAGGVGMAFAVSGATLFSILSSSEVDQRLVLGGYRPLELLLGRLMFLAPLGSVIAAGVHRHHGRGLRTGQAVADGARGGGRRPAVDPVRPGGRRRACPVSSRAPSCSSASWASSSPSTPDSLVSKLLPFYGPQELISSSLSSSGPILAPLLVTALYGLGLLFLARLFVSRRVEVTRHARTTPPAAPDESRQVGA